MIDRLIALLLALTVVAPAAMRPPCCCATPGVAEAPCCALGEGTCCESSPEAKLPPCCRQDGTLPPLKVPCGCQDCPATKPIEPLATFSAAATLDDLPTLSTWIDSTRRIDHRLVRCVVAPLAPLDRPPPDRQTLLCVWTI